MSNSTVFNILLLAVFMAAPLVFASLFFSTAPYGRHMRKTPGPSLPTRAAWVYMESPSVFAFIYFFFLGTNALKVVPLVLLALWQAHYVHRTIIYPMQMRVRPGDRMPTVIATMGFVFNLINSYLNATWIGTFGNYPVDWMSDPRFVFGLLVFAIGYFVNRQSDTILRGLRKPGETGYAIPHGGLFRWVSCPNYFGELLTWAGWTIATWSLAGLSFAVFTAANLVPRAIANHRWYQSTFEDYPRDRRAILPYVL